jgi:hypothetical protein
MATTRRKFFGLMALLAATAVGWRRTFPRKKSKTTRMLTRDGRLVEIDLQAIPRAKKKARLEEMQTWIWPKKG